MANIHIYKNPLDPSDFDTLQGSQGEKVWEVIYKSYPTGFGGPVQIGINEMRRVENTNEALEHTLKQHDTVNVYVIPGKNLLKTAFFAAAAYFTGGIVGAGGFGSISGAFAGAGFGTAATFGTVGWALNNAGSILSILGATAFKGGQSSITGVTSSQDQIYNINAQGNAPRIGGTIPVIYGEVVHTPDFAAYPYTSFTEVALTPGGNTLCGNAEWNKKANNSWVYMLYALGQGEHTIKEILVGTIKALPNYQHGDNVADGIIAVDLLPKEHNHKFGLLADRVNSHITDSQQPRMIEDCVTAAGIINLPLDYENVKHHTAEFPRHKLDKVFIDLSMPEGLYLMKNNKFEKHDINVTIEVLKYSDDSVLKTSTLTLENDKLNELTAWHRSFVLDVSDTNEPIKVRVTRTSPRYDIPQNSGDRRGDMLVVSSVRGAVRHSPATADARLYEDCHMMAVCLKAQVWQTQNTAIHTRLVRKINNIETNSPSVLFRDILTDDNYGAGWGKGDLDEAFLQRLDNHWGVGVSRFGTNTVFKNRVAVENALAAVLSNVASVPTLRDSQYSIIVDGKRKDIKQMFSEANIVTDSLSINYSWHNRNDYDGIQVQYTDPITWTPQHVWLPNENLKNAQQVSLTGITDKQTAIEAGQLLLNRRKYLRKVVSFQTSTEAMLVYPGDLIGVSHSLFEPGSSGEVLDWDATTRTLTVSSKLKPTYTKVVLRDRWGKPTAQLDCTCDPDSHTIVLSKDSPIPIDYEYDESASVSWLPTNYVVGETSVEFFKCITQNVSVAGNNGAATITATVYDDRVYDNTFPHMAKFVNE